MLNRLAFGVHHWCCRHLQALAHPEESCLPKTADGEYDSAFPNVGLVVWQAGFVLGEWLLRAQPLGPWGKPLRVLELGCGIGGDYSSSNGVKQLSEEESRVGNRLHAYEQLTLLLYQDKHPD